MPKPIFDQAWGSGVLCLLLLIAVQIIAIVQIIAEQIIAKG